MHQYDVALSRAAADEAVARVDEHAEPDFKTEALALVYEIARVVPEFTTDRVWYELGRRGVAEPHEPRALGPIMRRAQGLDWILDTGRVHLTVQESAHRRPKRVWRSLICEDGA